MVLRVCGVLNEWAEGVVCFGIGIGFGSEVGSGQCVARHHQPSDRGKVSDIAAVSLAQQTES